MLAEVLKHIDVVHVDHVDLDGDVIDVCKENFPWGAAWSDPRVTLHVADGAAFANDAPDGRYVVTVHFIFSIIYPIVLAKSLNEFFTTHIFSYDVIIQDSSDPYTTDDEGNRITLPSSVLYAESHFLNLKRILAPDGILNLQAETFTIPSDLEDIVEWREQALEAGFASATYGSMYISSYPTGQIGFLLLEKSPKKASKPKDIEKRYKAMRKAGQQTSYYHPVLQKSSFDLPLWVHETIYNPSASSSSDDAEQEL